MVDYPYDLRGRQSNFEGIGRKGGEAYKSPEFTLSQGILIAKVEHHGRGDFKLQFFPFEMTGADVISVGSVAAGAAVGSVVPVAGTIVGGLLGAAVGWLVGGLVTGASVHESWRFEHEGAMDYFAIARIKENEKGCLAPAKYRLEVESESKWSCRFIQPDLDQSIGPLANEGGDDYKDAIPSVDCLIGPRTSGTRPLLANIRNKGGGRFHAAAYSVDGTHECVLYEQEEGQFHVEDVQTEIRPGKEYMVVISADGKWSLTFTEGY